MKILTLNCKPDLSYFTSRGLQLDCVYKKINKIFPVEIGNPAIAQDGTTVPTAYPNPVDYFNANFNTGEYDIIMLGYTRNEYRKYKKEMANTGGKTFLMPLMPKRTYVVVYCVEENRYATHEVIHALSAILLTKYGKIVHDYMDTDCLNRPYFLNNDPENPLSNYSQTWSEIKPYLNLLNGIIEAPRWKYFNKDEGTGSLGYKISDLDPILVDKLDIVRGLCGFPFKINSGYRTEAENKAVGGVDGSAHTKRLAVDIACTDATKRLTIVGNAWNNGFVGIGIASSFIHLDIDSSLSRRIWLY